MATLALLAQSAVIIGVLWVARRIYALYFARSPLDNIPGPQSTSFWAGNFKQFFNRHGWAFRKELAEKYGPVVKLNGFFGSRFLFIYDPVALYSITIKDQHDYEKLGTPETSTLVVFGPGLLTTRGEHHRKQRKLLNPVFSMRHMRYMTPIFYDVVHRLRRAMAAQLKESPQEIDMLRWMGRTALELIGQGGLGYSFDPLERDVPNDFGDAIKNFVPAIADISRIRFILPYFDKIGTPAFRRWVLHKIPSPRMRRFKGIVDTLHLRSREIYREKMIALEKGDEAVQQQIAAGKDLMSILLRVNLDADGEDRLEEDEIIAQISTFVFAAMDTTSNALAQILQLLATHQDIQDKLRREIMEAREGQDIPYDRLVELPYMDAICREALRLFPPVSSLVRETRRDMLLPLSEPIRGRDGTLMHELLVPKDTGIVIGIHASNCNKAIWGEDALEFKPERWLSPLPETVANAHLPGVYSHLMTFHGGSRGCIGFKFSQLEMKVVLSVLMESFKFSASEKHEIYWNLAGIKYPSASKTSTEPSMPMKVELVG